jgi:hypothetical protein
MSNVSVTSAEAATDRFVGSFNKFQEMLVRFGMVFCCMDAKETVRVIRVGLN